MKLQYYCILSLLIVMCSWIMLAPTAYANQDFTINTTDEIVLPAGFLTNPAPGSKVSREIEYEHDGIDLANDFNTPILAAADGIVMYTQKTLQNSGGYGYYILLQHRYLDNYIYTLYAHLSQPPTISKGDEIFQGHQIGFMGDTGYATGIHLHFSIMADITLKDGAITNHPNCLRRYGNYASKCLSPLDEPIQITSFNPPEAHKDTPNPTYTSLSVIDMQTNNTNVPVSNEDIAHGLFDLFIDNKDTCLAQNPHESQNYAVLVSRCSSIFYSTKNNLSSTFVSKKTLSSYIINGLRQTPEGRSVLPQTIVYSDFDDVDSSDHSYSDIQRVADLGIFSSDVNNFNPNQIITRKQAAEALIKTSELLYI